MTTPPDRAPADDEREVPVAPVATEEGTFGTPPPPAPPESPPSHAVSRALVGSLLAGAVALWIAVLSVAQATDEPVALAALNRGVAALTEIDALLDLQIESVQEQADAGAPTLTPPGYPVRDSEVSAAAVTRPDGTVDRELLRDALLRKSARLIYTRGVGAFRPAGAEPADIALRSTSGGIGALLDNLSSDNHGTAVVLLWPLGALCLLLAALLLALTRGFGRFVALGVALFAAAVAVLLGGLAVRLALGLVDADPTDVLVEEFLSIGRDLAWLPVRNALWLAAAGVAVALPAALINAQFERLPRRPARGGVAES